MSTFCTVTSGIWSENLAEVGSDETAGGALTRLAELEEWLAQIEQRLARSGKLFRLGQ